MPHNTSFGRDVVEGTGAKGPRSKDFGPCWQELIESNLLVANEELSPAAGFPELLVAAQRHDRDR